MIKQFADQFAKVVRKNDTTIEWSVNWADIHSLFKNFSRIGVEHVHPEKENWVRGLKAWRVSVHGLLAFQLSGTSVQMTCTKALIGEL
jgi:hypothetical protein